MEEYLKRCESHVTTKTWRAMEEDMEMISSKKRKFYSELRTEEYCGGGDVEPAPENPVSPATSRTSGGSDKHEEHSNDVVKKRSSDLESEVFETEISTCIDRVFREATPTSELYGDSEQVLLQSLSTPKKKSSSPPANPRRKIVESTPSAAELDEFFAAAEKYDRKRFVEKYNYDIVKDVPLEGKYQWVRLQD
ncbi:cyclin-dependent kinase inhibitor 7 [Phtheirospermum japonicum]|uniref:Cyclin-dependent kinase inhibitor n=1 Tax=Phtheirospermum japonicum TaxID=374723 RepID=A0A830BHG4_9LAMI|nr:cyclin-dependent kinase inhibitor 7 [Phtheirospermum japonicum]